MVALRELLEASRERPIWRIWLEALPDPSNIQYELAIRRYRNGKAETERLANVSPHGWWIEPEGRAEALSP